MIEPPSTRVSLSMFEGPLDLLLYLVKRDEVEIYDIELARITQQYLECLAQMQEMNLEVAGEFLVMAAQLLYLKSKTLLPPAEQAVDDAPQEDDPRWELIRQLIEYKKFKDAAFALEIQEERQRHIFHRENTLLLKENQALGPGRVTMLDLISAFQKTLDRLYAQQQIHELTDDAWTVAQKIEFLMQTIPPGKPARFSRLFGALASRNEIVVTFLALLELVRLQQLRVKQDQLFDDIQIERT